MTIEVLLCQDIDKLGWLGDVVEVSNGYARNYLLPQGLAKPATEANIRAIAQEKAGRAEQRMSDRKRLEAAAAAVEGAEAVVAAAANPQGHLFGSVGANQIAANLREQGFEVVDEIVQLPERIKQVGTSTVTLKFADDLTATVNIVVVTAGAEPTGPASSEQSERAEELPATSRGKKGELPTGQPAQEPTEKPEQTGEENEPADKDS